MLPPSSRNRRTQDYDTSSEPLRIALVIESYDHNDLFETEWSTEPGETVDYWMSVSIGPGDGSADHFQLRVASPDSMNEAPADDRRVTILIDPNAHSHVTVLEQIEQIVEECRRTDWADSVEQLAKRFRWEYEDYSP